MAQVDFKYVGRGEVTIFRSCFQKYVNSRYVMESPEMQWSKLVPKTEKVFDLLVEQGKINGFNVDAILELPDGTGSTCYNIASCCSWKICNYFIERDIKLNSINTDMVVPSFQYPDLAVKMMEKGKINPHVIDYKGNSKLALHPSSFESEEAKGLLDSFPRSVHFSIEDIPCRETCPAECPSKFSKFYYKNGALVEMEDSNRIGSGGFGMVFRNSFHGIPMAMKCVWIGPNEQQNLLRDVVSDLENNISELRIQTATVGAGVIVPEAFVIQQNQEDQDENGNWIADNYNIFIYPIYDCNVYELHQNHFDKFTEEILSDIFHQCLTRKGSK